MPRTATTGYREPSYFPPQDPPHPVALSLSSIIPNWKNTFFAGCLDFIFGLSVHGALSSLRVCRPGRRSDVHRPALCLCLVHGSPSQGTALQPTKVGGFAVSTPCLGARKQNLSELATQHNKLGKASVFLT
ncbi:hypothetical protein THAOC_20619 [Thalassiosira oceanica]|uniref:Uncharacterized protein n=1 Tax=Thalassiosira oceanica TaxID=159749 RepID=K0SL75_THAOC|nr:hypothetical protein THAOC_20619 [Thalassiosira oceanica]|eukprot:EJK59192.1 hypothetical protein THAOC_20619 [Thalassiosira oceanica]